MKKRRILPFLSIFFILCTLGLSAAQQQTNARAFFLHDSDRVVFYGDSITAQRYYTRYVEDFLLTRYPGMNVEFFNAGVPGDTVYGGYTGDTAQRLDRDVFPFKPTVVTVMLGMNDPGYVPFDQHIFEVFQGGYKTLLTKLTTALPQVRLTLIASSPYDEVTHGTDFPGLSQTVQRYGMFVRELAAGRQESFADFNTPLDAVLHAAMRENQNYAALLIPDRIHPSQTAHWVMAEELMRAWHASPEISRVEVDAAKGSAVVSRNADVSEIQVTGNGITWTALEHALPLPFSMENPMMQFTLRVTDLEALDQEILQVRGLSAQRYHLQIDGKPIADLTSDQLSRGVNLALLPTPMLNQANEIDGLEERKTTLDAARFLLEAEMPSTAGSPEAVQTLRSAEKQTTREQREKVQPKAHKFALIAIEKSR